MIELYNGHALYSDQQLYVTARSDLELEEATHHIEGDYMELVAFPPFSRNDAGYQVMRTLNI